MLKAPKPPESSTKLNLRSLRLADWGILMVYGLCRVLPVSWVSGFGAWRGRYRGAQLAELEARARANLAEIAPQADPAVVLPRLRAESGRALLEVLIADRLITAQCITWQASAELDQAVRNQRSIVFALTHIANLGDVLGGAVLDRVNHFRHREVVTRAINNPTMRWVVEHARRRLLRSMPGYIQAPDTGLARRIVRELTHPPTMVMLHVDEARDHQVAFPCFDSCFASPSANPLPSKGINAQYAVRLARRAGACLVPLTLARNPKKPTHFSVHVLACWDMATESHDDKAVLQTMSELFETEILKDPSKWLNIYHRRPHSDLTSRDRRP